MKKLLLISFFGALFLSGCGTTPEVTSYVHPLSGRRTDILGENLLDQPDNHREMIWLNAYRDWKPNGSSFTYYLEVVYGATEQAGYLDIGPGRSLTIEADGEELHFTGLGSMTKDQDKGAVFENARYDASAYDIQKIATADKVTVKVSGRNGLVVRDFAEENFKKFRDFAAQTASY
jgi:hypothetical protein